MDVQSLNPWTTRKSPTILWFWVKEISAWPDIKKRWISHHRRLWGLVRWLSFGLQDLILPVPLLCHLLRWPHPNSHKMPARGHWGRQHAYSHQGRLAFLPWKPTLSLSLHPFGPDCLPESLPVSQSLAEGMQVPWLSEVIISEDAECREAAQHPPQSLLPKGKKLQCSLQEISHKGKHFLLFCFFFFLIVRSLFKTPICQPSVLHQLGEQKPSQASQSSAEMLPLWEPLQQPSLPF